MQRNLKRYFFVLLFLLCTKAFWAQTNPAQNTTATRAFVNCDAVFPTCFIGNWKGKLQWMVAGKPTREFMMQLNIQPTATTGEFTWQIIYGEANDDNRPYILRSVDTTKGHWVIDENDGILLDGYVHGNSMHSAFTVQDNTIVNNYKIEEGRMQVEFFSVQLNDKNISGKGTEETPLVSSYKISGYQTGVLLKVR